MVRLIGLSALFFATAALAFHPTPVKRTNGELMASDFPPAWPRSLPETGRRRASRIKRISDPSTSNVPPVCSNPNGPQQSVTSKPVALTYYQKYSGTGVTINPTNPGNDPPSRPPVTLIYPGTECIGDAIQACANDSEMLPDQYWSFNIYYRVSSMQWVCYAIINPNNDASYMNVQDSDVGPSYLYSTP